MFHPSPAKRRLLAERLSVIATDIARLYKSLRLSGRDGCDVATFETAWVSGKYEYLFYAGSTPSIPFHVRHIEELMAIATAYLSIPAEASCFATTFGLHLCYFLFFQQPSLGTPFPVRLAIAVDDLSRLMKDHLERHMTQAPSPLPASPTRRRAVLSSDGVVLLALLQADAWNVQPYVRHAAAVNAILNAHDAHAVPLLSSALLYRHDAAHAPLSQPPSHGETASRPGGRWRNTDATLARDLADYEQHARSLGLR